MISPTSKREIVCWQAHRASTEVVDYPDDPGRGVMAKVRKTIKIDLPGGQQTVSIDALTSGGRD